MTITISGGGSLFFTRRMLQKTAKSDILAGAEIVLVETNPLLQPPPLMACPLMACPSLAP